ncbi:MAG: hypothetical protein V3T86_12590 [Planctomycetota bacterium]
MRPLIVVLLFGGAVACSSAAPPVAPDPTLVIPLTVGGDVRLSEHRLLLDVDLRRETLPDGWRVETGTWTPAPDGLVGSIDKKRAAVLWCDASFPFDVAIRIEAEPLDGNTNDANAFFRAAGTIYGAGNQSAWIVGIAGWYVHDDGLERHPGGPAWRIKGEPLREGNVVEFVAGVRRDHVFLWKAGTLLLERDDPAPLDPKTHDRVGLGTWDSKIRFRRLRVYRIDG